MQKSLKSSIESLKLSGKFEDAALAHVSLHKIFDRYRVNYLVSQSIAICATLRGLADKDLVLLDEEIGEDENADLLQPCLADLDRRLDKYWERQLAALPNHGGLFQATTGEDKYLKVIDYPVDIRNPGAFRTNRYGNKQITLTFDDGPHATRTDAVLAALAHYHARAIFFNKGDNASRYPYLTKKILAAGHSLGSHTYDHPDLARISFERATEEIVRGHVDVFIAAGGLLSPFFRYPYGSETDELREFLARKQIETFRWNIDSMDWNTPDVSELIEKVEAMITQQGKGVILMHDIQRQTAMAVPYILEFLYQNNYTLVVPRLSSVDQDLIYRNPPIIRDQPDAGEIYARAGRSSQSHPRE